MLVAPVKSSNELLHSLFRCDVFHFDLNKCVCIKCVCVVCVCVYDNVLLLPTVTIRYFNIQQS